LQGNEGAPNDSTVWRDKVAVSNMIILFSVVLLQGKQLPKRGRGVLRLDQKFPKAPGPLLALDVR